MTLFMNFEEVLNIGFITNGYIINFSNTSISKRTIRIGLNYRLLHQSRYNLHAVQTKRMNRLILMNQFGAHMIGLDLPDTGKRLEF